MAMRRIINASLVAIALTLGSGGVVAVNAQSMPSAPPSEVSSAAVSLGLPPPFDATRILGQCIVEQTRPDELLEYRKWSIIRFSQIKELADLFTNDARTERAFTQSLVSLTVDLLTRRCRGAFIEAGKRQGISVMPYALLYLNSAAELAATPDWTGLLAEIGTLKGEIARVQKMVAEYRSGANGPIRYDYQQDLTACIIKYAGASERAMAFRFTIVEYAFFIEKKSPGFLQKYFRFRHSERQNLNSDFAALFQKLFINQCADQAAATAAWGTKDSFSYAIMPVIMKWMSTYNQSPGFTEDYQAFLSSKEKKDFDDVLKEIQAQAASTSLTPPPAPVSTPPAAGPPPLSPVSAPTVTAPVSLPDIQRVGEWYVRCFPVQSLGPCDIYWAEFPNKNVPQLSLSIAYYPSRDRYALAITTPLEVKVNRGLTIQTDIYTSPVLPYRRCVRDGCHVEQMAENELIQSLAKSSPIGKINITSDKGQNLALLFPLKDFTAARDVMVERAKAKAVKINAQNSASAPPALVSTLPAAEPPPLPPVSAPHLAATVMPPSAAPIAKSASTLAISDSELDEAKRKCTELGFKPRTEKFGTCVLTLTK